MQQIAQQLMASRKQVGLHGPPSQEMIAAERKLAEASNDD